ncbi:MAG: glutathione S-transferase family protein, partial [Pseudomonas sp.]
MECALSCGFPIRAAEPSMSELILHHSPTALFAEKARLLLGFKGLSWRSVKISP